MFLSEGGVLPMSACVCFSCLGSIGMCVVVWCLLMLLLVGGVFVNVWSPVILSFFFGVFCVFARAV